MEDAKKATCENGSQARPPLSEAAINRAIDVLYAYESDPIGITPHQAVALIYWAVRDQESAL
jgi:hypothetical protein